MAAGEQCAGEVIAGGIGIAAESGKVCGDAESRGATEEVGQFQGPAADFALGLFPPQPGTVLPDGGFHTYIEGQRLRARFTRPLDRTGVTLVVQSRDDLVVWTDLATSVNSAVFTGPDFVSENRAHPLPDPGLVEVRDILNAATTPRRQMRLRITVAP